MYINAVINWLVACLAPSHYLIQWKHIVNLIFKKKNQSRIKMKTKMSLNYSKMLFGVLLLIKERDGAMVCC